MTLKMVTREGKYSAGVQTVGYDPAKQAPLFEVLWDRATYYTEHYRDHFSRLLLKEHSIGDDSRSSWKSFLRSAGIPSAKRASSLMRRGK